jgi:rubrerythrin
MSSDRSPAGRKGDRNIPGKKQLERIVMALPFNARHILEIAIEIENAGRLFYIKAAERIEDPATRELLLQLADWEKGHAVFFSKLLEKVKNDQEVFNYKSGEEDVAKYLKVIADSKVYRTELPAGEWLSGSGNPGEILRMALQREKDAVIYFVALKFYLLLGKYRDTVDKIIIEELNHMRFIQDKLSALEDQGI